ncbi:translation initiation factor eIF-2B subunit delta-like [Phoenix dactylifera]|uniref:Translation initiation factor eIF2B subunit delta n=1 Tax=Phoenix dactylifera TaxID=42345 RepID=A0A8B7BGR7_PHODC|nr:translation initiation factor eIF-2B subunit delta-like [Phoenix dactylifera]XP_038987905.1 translation initiation factor eIF-2B subunit delta-like [Phoenix dactylifera]XP_038987906.1 translation initiation factor eIF-2B subunit delta-like [Phoenix dactylifera]
MDRRVPRTVIDPKFRQVGFVPPGATPPPARSHSVPNDARSSSELSLSGSSLSPVMIPPPRHASADGLPSVVRSAASPVPIPASPLRRDTVQIPIGSYNPSESLLGSSPMMSPSRQLDAVSEFSDDVPTSARLGRSGSGKFASSFPSSSGEMMTMKITGGGGGGNTPKSSLTTASVVKALPGVSEKDRGALIEVQNEGISKPQKQKTQKLRGVPFKRLSVQRRLPAKESGEAVKPSASSGGALPALKQGKVVKPSSQKKDGPQVTAPVASSEKKVVDRIPDKDRKKDVPHPRMQFDDKHRVEKAKRRAVVNQSEARNRVELFRHLPQYIHGTQLPDLESKFFQLDPMHPSVYKVGLQFLSGDISGGNARCIAMLLAFQEAIKDYSTPPEKVLVRDLTAKIGCYVSFLIECRPLSISMGNAIKFLKNRIAKLPHTLSESEAKSTLISDIDRFINEKIIIADKVIVRHAVTKIRDGDVLLTYGSSSIVEMILLYAHELGKQFRVVVVDSRPTLEGQALLHKLVAKGLNCTYTHINAISYVMHEVTRVFLGASSVLSNGTVYSRVGTACVAMVANAFQVPVLICCEAYKFHERVQLDSICSNELGDPDVISKVPGRNDLNHLHSWADNENLQLLNLIYDATPSDYISMIITDYGMIPPTSVPVIVREYRREHLWI